MKKLTLEMVAKIAGVGIATVDRVLNERGGVSPETTRKVLKAARELGLKRLLPEEYRHPWQIEVFLSNNGSSFFQQLVRYFSEVAGELGYRRITLHKTLAAESQPEKLAQSIIARSATRDGIIVFGHDYPPSIARWRSVANAACRLSPSSPTCRMRIAFAMSASISIRQAAPPVC